MKISENSDELAEVLSNLSEAGLIDIVIGDGGEASFMLSAAITDEGPDGIAALLASIEPVPDSREGA